jgi:CheY-like chemotaxis protein
MEFAETRPRVLVADDDPDLLEAVAEALARAGYDVVRATSGGELIDQLATEPPFDLIVSDVSMPWMNGLEALRSMRTAGLATPVIVMTALTSPTLPDRIRGLGEHVVLLPKPFELDALFKAVAALTAPAHAAGEHSA